MINIDCLKFFHYAASEAAMAMNPAYDAAVWFRGSRRWIAIAMLCKRS